MTTILGRFALDRLKGESGMTEQIIVRFLSVFEEVMTKYAHRPLFQLVSLGEKLRPCFEIVCFSSLTRRQFVSGSHVGV